MDDKKRRKKEFKENRTSWKWFERRALNSIKFRANNEADLEFRLLLEILKELQFLNDENLKV